MVEPTREGNRSGGAKRIADHPSYAEAEPFTLERAEAFCWSSQTMSSFRFIKLIHKLIVERDAAIERVRELEDEPE